MYLYILTNTSTRTESETKKQETTSEHPEETTLSNPGLFSDLCSGK